MTWKGEPQDAEGYLRFYQAVRLRRAVQADAG